MVLRGETPALVQQLSNVVGEELAEQIVDVAMDATNNSVEAEIFIRDAVRQARDQKFKYLEHKSSDSIL